VGDEGRLERVEVLPAGQTLDRRDVEAVLGDGEQQARVRAVAADEDGARAALPVVAALFRSGEPEVLAQDVEEGRARIEVQAVLGVVDAEGDVGVMGHRSIVAPGPAGRRTAARPGAKRRLGSVSERFGKKSARECLPARKSV
jgi:hypothetical protein